MAEVIAERPSPYYLSTADGMSDDYIHYARKLVSMSYQTLCCRQLQQLNPPAFRPWSDEENLAFGQEKARLTELGAMLASNVIPSLGLDGEALRTEAESSLTAGRKLEMVTAPFESWADGVVFRYLYSMVLTGQLSAVIGSNYVPYANWAQETYFSFCLKKWPTPIGSPHFGRMERTIAEEGREMVQRHLEQAWPRAMRSFGADGSANEAAYLRLGLKTRSNQMCRRLFLDRIEPDVKQLGLTAPSR